MNPILKQIADQSPADLAALIAEAEEDILTAIHKAEAEAQQNEAKPKFSLTLKIALDLDARTITNRLSWSVAQSLETSHEIDDPDQGTFGLNNETSMTLATEGMDPVTVTASQLKRASRALSGKK